MPKPFFNKVAGLCDEITKNTFFTENLCVTASTVSQGKLHRSVMKVQNLSVRFNYSINPPQIIPLNISETLRSCPGWWLPKLSQQVKNIFKVYNNVNNIALVVFI